MKIVFLAMVISLCGLHHVLRPICVFLGNERFYALNEHGQRVVSFIWLAAREIEVFLFLQRLRGGSIFDPMLLKLKKGSSTSTCRHKDAEYADCSGDVPHSIFREPGKKR